MIPQKKPRRTAMELQLTTMVDVFTIIVIFLIKGTFFGAADIALAPGAKLPKSISKEQMESAPQVTIDKEIVTLSNLVGNAQKIPLADFKGNRDEKLPSIETMKASLKTYVDKMSPAQKKSGVFMNVAADRKTPYTDIFHVIRLVRESGFESFLFVAMADKPPVGFDTGSGAPGTAPGTAPGAAPGAAPKPGGP